ncbi:MAG TPA: DUF4249 domain-containing protein [Puia sp.]|nr:DUF4249 domain-containing protein [Puia sp.]
MRPCNAILLICLSCSIGCKQTYQPPAIANPPDYLVVEGFINTNPGESTTFNLSHTIKVDTNLYTPEPGATVTVEGSDNNQYRLPEAGTGSYTAPLSGLDYNITYRLHIITAKGKQYASDYFPLRTSPPIDSISWRRLENDIHQGIQVYASTHDPQNKTHYYRWDYQETWEFHSHFFATAQYVPVGHVQNYSPNTISVCWKSDQASNILLGTTKQLSQDVIHEAPLALIPLNSQQISVRYSILVKQYALTDSAFNWWQIMQKNTEQLGSIFGVQPSANMGNIHCLTDPSETVLGFVGGGNVQSQRIFITIDQVRPWVYNPDCTDNTIPNNPDSIKLWYDRGYLPWYVDISPPQVHVAYATCVDCTLTGSNIKPSFW